MPKTQLAPIYLEIPGTNGNGNGRGLRPTPKLQEKRKVKNGKPSNELVLSAYTEGNDSVFPRILGLYVKPGSPMSRMERASFGEIFPTMNIN
jgi:hypothetical protein